MKIVSKNELQDILDCAVDRRVVFAEYSPDIVVSDVMVAERDFGATDIVPHDGETFCWDWNIGEYSNNDMFVVFDVADICQMIRTLVRGLPEDLLTYISEKEN